MSTPLDHLHLDRVHLDRLPLDRRHLDDGIGRAVEFATDHVDRDAIEHAVETFVHTAGDVAERVGALGLDVAETVGEVIVEDVVPAARTTVRRTTRIVRAHPRVSLATLVGVIALIGLVVWWRSRGDDVTSHVSVVDDRDAA